jgi:hypothetical protein
MPRYGGYEREPWSEDPTRRDRRWEERAGEEQRPRWGREEEERQREWRSPRGSQGSYGEGPREREWSRGDYPRRGPYGMGEERGARDRLEPIGRPWVESYPDVHDERADTKGLVEWEDKGPLEWMGDRFRELKGKLRGPKGYTRSDERIQDEVCERIARCGVDAGEVEIRVEKGEVTLTGTVPSRQEKWRLEQVADDVFGVEEVHNNVRVSRVRPGEGTAPSKPVHH